MAHSEPQAAKEIIIEREYKDAAIKYGLDPKLFKAVLLVESNLNHTAVNPDTFDFGIGQINYKTAEYYGIDTSRLIHDRAYSIDRAAFVLSKLKHKKLVPESIGWVCYYNIGASEIRSSGRRKACERYLVKLRNAYQILGYN